MRQAPVLFTLLVIAVPLAAQAPATLPAGSEVRVVRLLAGGQRAELARGRLERRDADSIVIRSGPDTMKTVPLTPDRVLEVRTGSRSHIGIGATVGALVGLVVGAVAGAESEPQCPSGCMFAGVETASGAAVGFLAGAAVGALLGSQVKSPTWTAVIPPVRVTFGIPAGRGAVAGLRFRF